jgi:hypothetical protein
MRTLTYLATLELLQPAAEDIADAINDAEAFADLVTVGSLACGRAVLLAAAGVKPARVESFVEVGDDELDTLAALRGVDIPGWVRDSL